MTENELEAIVRSARGLDPGQAFDRDDEWDSLDHLAIIASLSQIDGGLPEGVDVSQLTSLSKLSEKLCD
jgi:acyl carrier protein